MYQLFDTKHDIWLKISSFLREIEDSIRSTEYTIYRIRNNEISDV